MSILHVVTGEKDQRAAVVDEMGRISERLREMQPLAARYAQLEEEARSWHVNDSAEEQYTHEGKQYSVKIGARGEQRVVKNVKALKKALGETKWMKVIKVTLTALDKVMTVEDQAAFVEKKRTGNRPVVVTRKDLGDDWTPGRAA